MIQTKLFSSKKKEQPYIIYGMDILIKFDAISPQTLKGT